MPFTLTPIQTEEIKDAIQSVFQKHALAGMYDSVDLIPDENYDEEPILQVVVRFIDDDPGLVYPRANAKWELVNTLWQSLTDHPAQPMPVLYFIDRAEYDAVKTGMLNALA